MRGDGDGWSLGPDGLRHWGRFGAAGLLLRAPLAEGGSAVLLQHRAPWSHQGGTWALPGGARDSHETPVHAAVREAWEETGIDPADVRVRGERVTASALSGWTYTTVVADAVMTLPTTGNRESTELAWVPEDEVDARPLHPGFAASWPTLRAAPARVLLAEIAGDRAVAAALPRTLDLADLGFVWLHSDPAGPGDYARIVDEPGAQVTEPASAGSTAVETALSFTRGQVLS
ncbi:NUDIX hydrolase [Nocardia gamkensis]|jgi:8-oxo-dGTP diphosphatase|uniref:NUDIX hydrolase n=1 Tax=Nocardia gamkensis TaxID=352869 RepID=A0A7X6L474_9NOCA|nr:NUDIX hydrolase [Nocardia gamkensis]NKY27349.1 NUDIX hydrolase [Nocardia gamkensis]NQE65873.1 putative 8-oxo-dGTP diphosphatase 3 [Nocardia gamkensis]